MGVEGRWEPAFQGLVDVLDDFLATGRDIGASLGVYHAGREVVRAWGGTADPATGRPWRHDTLVQIASLGKVTATAALLHLASRRGISLDDPVAAHWPAFGQNGKHRITIRQLLCHSAGLPLLDQPLTRQRALAIHPVFATLERQAPAWEPGTRHGYHGVTFGWLVSGLIHAITGTTLGPYFAEHIAAPLGLDLHVGLSPAEHHRVATAVTPGQGQSLAAFLNPDSFGFVLACLNPRSLSFRSLYGALADASFNDKESLTHYEIEDASSDAVGTGPALARLFAALSGQLPGPALVDPDLMTQARLPHTTGLDQVMRFRTDWGLGFALPGGPMWRPIGVPGLYGGVGATGSLAWANPEHQLAFAYTPNHMAELTQPLRRPHYRHEDLSRAAFNAIGVPTARITN